MNEEISLSKKAMGFGKGILGLLVFLYLPYLIIGIFFSNYDLETDAFQTYFSLGIQILFCLFFFLINYKTFINDFKDMKKNHRQHFNIIIKYWIYGLIVMMISNYIINIIINPGALAVNEELNRDQLGRAPILTAMAMVLFAPFTEEAIFRLGFRKAFSKAITFAVFSALLFGGMHLASSFDTFNISEILNNWKQLLYLIPYGALGFAFAYIYFKTNNIYSAIIAHAMHNGLSVLLILIVSLLG